MQKFTEHYQKIRLTLSMYKINCVDCFWHYTSETGRAMQKWFKHH